MPYSTSEQALKDTHDKCVKCGYWVERVDDNGRCDDCKTK
jgi:hypothetical protein